MISRRKESCSQRKTAGGLLTPGTAAVVILLLFSVCSGEESPTRITLSEGLKLATENSRIVRIASQERDISMADIMLARAAYFPSVNTSASQTFLAHQPGAIFG